MKVVDVRKHDTNKYLITIKGINWGIACNKSKVPLYWNVATTICRNSNLPAVYLYHKGRVERTMINRKVGNATPDRNVD
jgi:hypothetical protein